MAIDTSPFLTGFERDEGRWRDGFPFAVPAVASIAELDLSRSTTRSARHVRW